MIFLFIKFIIMSWFMIFLFIKFIIMSGAFVVVKNGFDFLAFWALNLPSSAISFFVTAASDSLLTGPRSHPLFLVRFVFSNFSVSFFMSSSPFPSSFGAAWGEGERELDEDE